MPFAPENPLEEVLVRAASDPSARPQFYPLLMQSPLYVLGQVEDHTAYDEVLPSLDERYFTLNQIKVRGRAYHPVFTAMSRMRTMTKGPREYFAARGRTLFENTRGAAFLINYGSEVGKELLPQEIEKLLDPRTRMARQRTDIEISLPEPYPGKLAGALGILFLNRSQVAAAHLVQAAFPGSNEKPHFLIALVAHGDARRIIAEIGEVATAMHSSHAVDVLVVDPARPRSEMQARLLATAPFYDRPITPQSQSKE